MLKYCIISILSLATANDYGQTKVISLNDTSFDEEIGKYDYLLVEFFAPWCHHCVALAPEYEKAAKLLSTGEPPLYLAKVDATVNKEVSNRFHVQGYPTMILFKDGKKHMDYPMDGSRKGDGIAIWMLKVSAKPKDQKAAA